MADSGDLREQIVGTSPNEITVINYNIASRSLPFDYIGLCHPLSQKMCNMENQLYRGQGITSGPIYKQVTRDYDATSLQKYVYMASLQGHCRRILSFSVLLPTDALSRILRILKN